MSVDILTVFRFGAVDVTRQVEIEVVLRIADLGQRHHPRELFDFGQPREGIDDFVDVLIAQPVLVAILHEALTGVDHEDPLASGRMLLVHDDDASRDARAVEQVRGESDDRFDVAALEQVLADDGFGIASKQHAVRKNAGSFAGALQRADDVQQVGVIALLTGRRAEVLEPLVGIALHIDTVAPAFVAERRIGDDVVEGLESPVLAGEERIGQRVALLDQRRGVVVQDHVHAGEASGRSIFFLPVERDLGTGGIAHLQQQRTGAAGQVIDGGGVGRARVADADDLRHDPADLGGGVELPLALATLGGEVPHQVFVGVAKDVIAVRAVLREIERRVLKDGDEVGEAFHLGFAVAELGGVVEVRHVGQLVGVGQRSEDLLVDLVANVGLALERDHVLEARAIGNGDRRVGHARVFVADVFHEQQHQDIVLVLAGIHAAAQLIATGPERAVEFRLLQSHVDFAVGVDSVVQSEAGSIRSPPRASERRVRVKRLANELRCDDVLDCFSRMASQDAVPAEATVCFSFRRLSCNPSN